MADQAYITRRFLLKAAPIASMAAAVPAVAVATTETPVMALFREWEAAQAVEDAAYERDAPNAEIGLLVDARHDIEQRMMVQPCRTPQDFICKVVAYTSFGLFCLQDNEQRPDLWAEARALVAA